MLKKTYLTAISIFFTATSAFACPCSEISMPTNEPPGMDYEQGLKFTETSHYTKEFDDAVASGKKFCTEYLEKHPGEKNLAIVSDIDETLLDNREQFRLHPVRDWKLFDTWVAESKAPELKATAEFLTWARGKGFAIFLVTGRPEPDRKATIINLVKVKFPYDGLYCRTERDTQPAEIYKTGVREAIEKMGFKIIVNIGDQYSDLYGGHSEDCEKLPNKMYYIK